MDYRTITIPELLKDADLQSAFLIECNRVGIKTHNKCTSCIVGYYQEYIKKLNMSKVTSNVDSIYRVVNDNIVLSPYSITISNANITDELVENLIARQPNAAAHFERVDGKPIGYKEPVKKIEYQLTHEVNATKDAIEYAELNGIDIDTVEGTGKNGRILLKDVKAVA